MSMNRVWVGYENIGFTPASTVEDDEFTELLEDASGMPILHDMCRLYVMHGRSEALREAVRDVPVPGPLVVYEPEPIRKRPVLHTLPDIDGSGSDAWREAEELAPANFNRHPATPREGRA
jgi:hypothetical protein